MEIFSDTQEQLTPQSEVGSGGNWNSFKLLWLSSLPARMKKIQLKMKTARVVPSLYIDFSDAQGQVTQ